MERKRILIVANTTWNIYKFRLNVIQRFLENDNEVFVAAPLDKFISYRDKFKSVTHIDLKNLKRNHKDPIGDFLSIFELSKIYKTVNPHVIIHYTHKPNIYGGIASWLTRKKSIAVVTGLGFAFINKGFVNKIIKFFYRLTKNIHDKIVFENEDDMNFFINGGLVKREKAVFVNGCGIDVEEYKPGLEQKSTSNIVFTFIGRLLKDKGINEFLKASEILSKNRKNIEFRIIGEFDEENPSSVDKKYLKRLVEENVITNIGFVNDIKPHIEQSSCIVLPSYREGMPRVILEAMAMAKPVVTTDVPGCRQTVENGINGFLVKHDDVEDLVSGMEKILHLDGGQLLNMGQKGREMAINRFNSEKISSDLYEIVSQVYFCAK